MTVSYVNSDDDLSNNLVKAFKDGATAADAFGKSVGNIMENLP